MNYLTDADLIEIKRTVKARRFVYNNYFKSDYIIVVCLYNILICL